MKLNWRLGFFRLTWIMSVFLGICLSFIREIQTDEHIEAIVLGLAGFGLVWLVYFCAKFVASGFFKEHGR